MGVISACRFDLMAKYLYIKFSDKSVKTNFYRELYHQHIFTFNNCWEYPGTKTSIETFKPDALRRFHKDWYRPDLMAVIVVGDIDPDAIEAKIKSNFDQYYTHKIYNRQFNNL